MSSKYKTLADIPDLLLYNKIGTERVLMYKARRNYDDAAYEKHRRLYNNLRAEQQNRGR